MAFLLYSSLEFIVLVPTLPMFWAAVGVIGAAAFLANSSVGSNPESGREYPRNRWLLELALMVLMPLLLLVVGQIFSYTNQIVSPDRDRLILIVLMVPVAVQAIISVYLIWRHRRRLFPTVAASIVTTAWAMSARGVAGMAATDNWL